MMGPGMMGGFGVMGFGAVFMVLFWGLIIWAVVALIQGPRPGTWGESHNQDSALEVLKRRYARGEISKEDYEEKKKDLA
ncbi:MAG: SHOCT domain-containing protein [Chloroflexi bacterium]|nr:SHOCT domain-containing protein [Chloroflexota bacterium]